MSNALDALRKTVGDRNAKPGDGSVEQQMKVIQVAKQEVTVAQLLAACEANKEHPVSQVYRDACTKLSPGTKITVDLPDITALLDNTEVETYETKNAEGRTVVLKRAGKKRGNDASAKAAPVVKDSVTTSSSKPS